MQAGVAFEKTVDFVVHVRKVIQEVFLEMLHLRFVLIDALRFFIKIMRFQETFGDNSNVVRHYHFKNVHKELLMVYL